MPLSKGCPGRLARAVEHGRLGPSDLARSATRFGGSRPRFRLSLIELSGHERVGALVTRFVRQRWPEAGLATSKW